MEQQANVSLSFFKDFIYLFLERGREGEKEGKEHQCVVAPHVPPTRDLAHNLGMHLDWELNPGPFGSQASTQSTEPHQPGPMFLSLKKKINIFFLSKKKKSRSKHLACFTFPHVFLGTPFCGSDRRVCSSSTRSESGTPGRV